MSAAFVIDLFGGLRRDRERAGAALTSAQDDLQTVRLAWLAEVTSMAPGAMAIDVSCGAAVSAANAVAGDDMRSSSRRASSATASTASAICICCSIIRPIESR